MTSAIPEGADIPNYMISLAKSGPDGPINSTLAQIYLPMHAQVLEVIVDGKSSQYQTFREQDRVAVLLALQLPPRQARTVRVEFSEPADDGPATAPQQPLANDQVTTIVDQACTTDTPAPEPSPTEGPKDTRFGPLVPLSGRADDG